MMKKTAAFAGVFFLSLVATLLIAQDVDQARRWIDQLGSPDGMERQEAEQHLLRMGHDAMPALESSTGHVDPRVREKVTELIGRILSGDVPDTEPKDPAFERESKSQGPPKGWDPIDPNKMPGGMQFTMKIMGNGFALEQGPDGIRLTLTDPEGNEQVFEAPTLEEFAQKFPEMAEKYGFGRPGEMPEMPDFGKQLEDFFGEGGPRGLEDFFKDFPNPGMPENFDDFFKDFGSPFEGMPEPDWENLERRADEMFERMEKSREKMLDRMGELEELLEDFDPEKLRGYKDMLKGIVPGQRDEWMPGFGEEESAPRRKVEGLGAILTPTAEALRAQLELGDRGVTVTGLVPGGNAERLGFEHLDVLLAINGKTVPADEEAAWAQIREASAFGTIEIDVLREGAAQTLTPSPDVLR